MEERVKCQAMVLFAQSVAIVATLSARLSVSTVCSAIFIIFSLFVLIITRY